MTGDDLTDQETPAEVRVLRASARRVLTPCGDGSIVWHAWGERSGSNLPPLVLLHGGSGSWTHWLRNITALAAAGRSVWVPDLPGFGDSAMPPDGDDADAMPAPLEEGLQRLLGEQACDLVGFSFGAMTAGLFAAAYPGRVRRLVLVGAPGFGIEPLQPYRLKGWRHLPRQAARDAVHRHNLAELMLHDPAKITPLACWLQADNAVRDRLPGRRLSRTPVLARCLQQLEQPAQLVYGSEDVFYKGQPERYVEALAAMDRGHSVVAVEGAGHWVQFERPAHFNALLLASLDGPG
ncbi:MAG: alpha/beta fold hydrolase [Pseudomonadota bacterium]